MEKVIFYAPDILSTKALPAEESIHCAKVLRMQGGDEILVTDGKGCFYDAVLLNAHQKHCIVEISQTNEVGKTWDFDLHIAFAPTKNMDRIEWFAEKATEIGIDRFTPLLCHHSERKVLKTERLDKILVSAMKQSQKAILPILDEMTPFAEFVKQEFAGRKFIAHCYDTPKQKLTDIYSKGESALILIGPEGDFSEKEVEIAVAAGFEPISLSESRLRTETAALVACHIPHVLS